MNNLLGIEIGRKVKGFAIVFVVLSLVFAYFYLARPLDLKDIINKNNIKEIYILTDTFTTEFKFPKELRLNNENDINTILDILSEYKYSRIISFYNPRIAPANPTNGVIHIFLTYSNTDNKLIQQYLFIDSENDVAIRNKHGINISYKISGLDKMLFEHLGNWLETLGP
ncbi:hypothetical protein ACHOLT_18700 [Desulfitobacterium sp. Sab5]|uniref:hypothetical protein n=1 Tax=Desulfitobacterium nosdiversum TaxID=3375356 RepID=UPI003CF9A485